MFNVNNKLVYLFALAVVVWQVSITGSTKLTKACGFGLPQPCKQADAARRALYGMAAGSAVGILLRKGKPLN